MDSRWVVLLQYWAVFFSGSCSWQELGPITCLRCRLSLELSRECLSIVSEGAISSHGPQIALCYTARGRIASLELHGVVACSQGTHDVHTGVYITGHISNSLEFSGTW